MTQDKNTPENGQVREMTQFELKNAISLGLVEIYQAEKGKLKVMYEFEKAIKQMAEVMISEKIKLNQIINSRLETIDPLVFKYGESLETDVGRIIYIQAWGDKEPLAKVEIITPVLTEVDKGPDQEDEDEGEEKDFKLKGVKVQVIPGNYKEKLGNLGDLGDLGDLEHLNDLIGRAESLKSKLESSQNNSLDELDKIVFDQMLQNANGNEDKAKTAFKAWRSAIDLLFKKSEGAE